MGFLRKAKKKLGRKIEKFKIPFKKKRKKKEKKKRLIPFLPCNACCCVGIIILLGVGMIAFGGNIFDALPTINEDGFIIPPRAWDSTPDIEDDVDEGIYYQIGLEFPVRNEDIDVLMVAELNTSDHLTFIENINLGPIGLYKSSNDYKPADVFFLSMFYGDAEYNISFSTVITVGGEQAITVYMHGVAIDEVINLTWIADGSMIRWDYP